MPLGFEEIFFEVDGFLFCEPEIAALSALSYALPGDRADDRERAGVRADDNPESCWSLLL
jgi:hypothetical protein